jgi:hypothetical protein
MANSEAPAAATSVRRGEAIRVMLLLLVGVVIVASLLVVQQRVDARATRNLIVVITPMEGTNVARMMDQAIAAAEAARETNERWEVLALDFAQLEGKHRVPETFTFGVQRCIVLGPASSRQLNEISRPIICAGVPTKPIIVSATGVLARAFAAPNVVLASPDNKELAAAMLEGVRRLPIPIRLRVCWDDTDPYYADDLYQQLDAALRRERYSKAPRTATFTAVHEAPACVTYAPHSGDEGAATDALLLVGSIGWLTDVARYLNVPETVLISDGLSSHAAVTTVRNLGAGVVYGFCPRTRHASRAGWFWGHLAYAAIARALKGQTHDARDALHYRLLDVDDLCGSK